MSRKQLLLTMLTIGLTLSGVVAGRNRLRAARPVPTADVLFRVGDHAVRAADLQAEVDRMAEAVRSRYASSPDERQAFFDRMVDREVFFQEAKQLGYDRDPEVVQATRHAMVVKLLTERLGPSPADGATRERKLAELLATLRPRRPVEVHAENFGQVRFSAP